MSKVKKNSLLVLFILASIICILFYIISANGDTENNNPLFSDVSTTDWFYNDVNYVSSKGIMQGMGNNLFSPYQNTTRGMLVTILWRLDGEVQETDNHFNDVNSDDYYYSAASWASNHQIVNGINETIFDADSFATREQLISILYRYASYKKYNVTSNTTLESYSDKSKISSYAIDAMRWGNDSGIIAGTSSSTISPQDYVQRCQAAAIFSRFCTKFINFESSVTNEEDSKNNQLSENSTVSPAATTAPSIGGSSSGGSSGSSGSVKKNDETPIPTLAPTNKPIDSNEENTNNIARLVVNSAEAKAGNDVQVSVTINNNPGILGMTLIAYYDETYCTLESVESGSAFNNVLDFTTSKTLNSGVKFLWDGIDITDEQVKDGTAVLMNFHISEKASNHNIPITIKCYDEDAVDRNLNTIPLQIENGSIIVKSD